MTVRTRCYLVAGIHHGLALLAIIASACGSAQLVSSATPAPRLGESSSLSALQLEELVLSEGGACGVFGGGRSRCWGAWFGEHFPESTAANGLTEVVELGVGQHFVDAEDQLLTDFFCARFSGGTVRCWGNGNQGQLGVDVGAGGGVMTPTEIEGMPPNIAGLALGWRHICAITGGGEAVCWGNNRDGQLGIGPAVGDKVARPSVVHLPRKVNQIVASLSGTCALLETGDVYCWGEHWTHESGETPKSNAWWPKLVKIARGSRQLSAASSTTCSVRLDGRIACWGHLESYFGSDHGLATMVPGIDDATAVAVGESQVCALRCNATLWCWGATNGDDLGGRSRPPVLVPLPGPVIRVVAGNLETCARLADHRWFCWGANRNAAIAPRNTGPIVSPRLLDLSEL